VFALSLAVTLAVPLALGAGTAGCDAGEWSFSIPAADAGPPDGRYQAACAAWAERFCAYQDLCPQDSLHWNPGQCVPRYTLQCQLIVGEPGVAFDPDRTASCPEPDGSDCSQPGGDLCLDAGSAPVGSPCFSDPACASGACEYFYGTYGNPSPCGVCAPRPCGGPCPEGQVCEPEVDGGASCVAIALAGQPCKVPADCASFFCAPSGTCGPLAQVGETCAADSTAPFCADVNAFCDPMTSTCRDYTFVGYGDSCLSRGEDQYRCSGLGNCDPNDGICVPPAGDGQFCDVMQELSCLPPARCVDHVCTFPSAASCGLL
jgi:hypothetical protein